MTGQSGQSGQPRQLVAKSMRVKDWTRAGRHAPLPDWVERVYPHQARAVAEIVSEFESCDVVMLDCPTGGGKTLIADLVRREMDLGCGDALYVCTTKSLQAQVVRDFAYARVLKGRTNYTPTNLGSREQDGYKQGYRGTRGIGVTCADCDAGPVGVPMDEQSCSYCEFVEDCPYGVARRAALTAEVGVLNTSYLLAECNGPGKFRGRELVVCDEADLLEREMLGYVEMRLSKRLIESLSLEVPKKGSHMTTIRAWLHDEVEPGLVEMRRKLAGGKGLDARREHSRVDRQIEDVRRVIAREEGWVREGDEEERSGSTDGLVLKPVSVEDVAGKYLWRHGGKWLLMSGTTVSAEGQADALGIEEAGLKWGKVDVPMLFPRENRRIIFAPLATMTRAGQEAGGLAKVLVGLERILARHPGDNVLVHSHTYKLAKEISAFVSGVDSRPVFTYVDARGREDALARFRARAGEGGAVLVASSMDRGIDLPGDDCRVQVIVKCPLLSLGSRQVSERLRTPGGQTWYLMGAIRTIMQMSGRAVRGKDDSCVTYVLDSHFSKLLKDGKRMGMFPEWWLDGLELGKVRDYV